MEVRSQSRFGPAPVPPEYAKAREALLTREDGSRVSYSQIANAAEIDVTYVCKIFTRNRRPSLSVAGRIAAYLGCSVDHLLSVLDM